MMILNRKCDVKLLIAAFFMLMLTSIVAHPANKSPSDSSHDSRLKTPLHYASESEDENLVLELIRKGADVNAKDSTGNTPLHYAAQARYQKTVEILIENGADINAKNHQGDSALTMAVNALVSPNTPSCLQEVVSSTKGCLVAVVATLIKGGSEVDDASVKSLIEALKHGPKSDDASDALAYIGKPAVYPIIKELEKGELQDKKEWGKYNNKETAIRILGDIGDDRAIPILIDSLMEWGGGPLAARYLKSFKYLPKTTKEKVYLCVALRDKEELLRDWEQSEKILIEELLSHNTKKVEAATYTLIASGKDETIPKLVNAMKEHGTVAMAETYLNSGNQVLKDAAKQWATDNEYHTTRVGYGSGTVKWGRF